MKRALLASLALVLASACSSRPSKPEGAAVLIKENHYHTRYCGHYRFGEQWYFLAQHRHGVDCGHELVDGDWILPTD
jgi:hypothetical protein